MSKGSSFLRPSECKNCETLHGRQISEGEICITIETQAGEMPPAGPAKPMPLPPASIGDIDEDILLEIESVCPYELSSLTLSFPKNGGKEETCKTFRSRDIPDFKIFASSTKLVGRKTYLYF